MSLTGKQRAFIEAYLTHFNATQAAKDAGYQTEDENTFAAIGYENLRKPQIREAIDQRLAERAMTANEVLWRLAEQARANMADFVNEFGGVNWQAVQEQGHLVKKTAKTEGEKSTSERIELYDAQSALDKLARTHNLYKDQSQVINIDVGSLTDEQLERIAAGEDALHVLATSGESGT